MILQKIDEYLSSPDVLTLAGTTQANYRYALKAFRAFLSTQPTDDFAAFAENKDQFLLFLQKQKLAGRTIQQYVTAVKIFMRWSGHPVELTHRIGNGEKKANQRKQLRRWFDESDVAKCLAYTFPKKPIESAAILRILVRLMAETGARVRELALVETKHIELEDYLVWLMDSKTEPRAAFFSPTTQQMIENQLKSRLLPTTGPMFPSVDNIKGSIKEMLIDLGLKKQGEKDGRGAHTFRHFVATRLFYVGSMRIEDIAFLLGDEVDTIVKNYLHPTPLMLRERVAKAMRWEI